MDERSAPLPTPSEAIEINVDPPSTPTATPLPPSTATALPTDTPTNTPTVTPLPSYQITSTADIALYLEPRFDLPHTAMLNRDIAPALTIQAQTVDGNWLQVCCFNLGAENPTKVLWIRNAPPITVIRREILVSSGLQQVLPPTSTPTPTHFEIEAGPEYYPTDNGFLSIFVKVFSGVPGAQNPLAGYLLKVRYKAAGTDEYLDRPSTYGGLSVNQYSSFKDGTHIYNLKYEYYPGGEIPPGKTMADLLGTGDWEMWLTNGEGIELSRRISFTTNPQNNNNREIFVSFRLVR